LALLNRRVIWPALFLSVTAATAAMTGCATNADQPIVVAAPGQSQEKLDAGRHLFTTHCQGCHALPAPSQMEARSWPAEVMGMGKKSGLSETQLALVSDYLVAASRVVR
jgi:mono/diheme cytochrome c family protein